MKSSDELKKPCILANLSLVLLATALLLFAYGVFFTGRNDVLWIGVGLVFVAFPIGIFSLINLYRPAFPGTFVPLNLAGETTDEVEALGIESDGRRWLFLTNRSATEPAQVTFDGIPPDK